MKADSENHKKAALHCRVYSPIAPYYDPCPPSITLSTVQSISVLKTMVDTASRVSHSPKTKAKTKNCPCLLSDPLAFPVLETFKGGQRGLQVQREEQVGERPHHLCTRLDRPGRDRPAFFLFFFVFFLLSFCFCLIFTSGEQVKNEWGSDHTTFALG